MPSRSMEIITPLGPDVLLFHALRGRDELGRTSEYEVELLSEKAFKLNDILGKNVTVKVTLADDSIRYFNGFVTRFAAGGRLGRYRRFVATVNSWTWFLTRTSDCRVFQNKTVQEIVEDVFADHEMADFTFELTASYEPYVYCVQYRETDFNFVSRLLEHHGIYYYFRHAEGSHKMMLTDSTSMHQATGGYETVPFYPPGSQMRPEEEHIHSWQFFRQVQPGVSALDDYDFERPTVDLKLDVPLVREYQPSKYEVFDYPGFFTQKKVGEDLARVRIDEFGSLFERAHGVTNARGITVGSMFNLTGYPETGTDPDQNREYLVLEANYDVSYSDYEALPGDRGSEFGCTFVTLPTDQQFRPRRITQKPFVQGPQTAMVVGPGGDEIHTDKYGRVKVQFHWDRRGERNDKSSCWIRVSHPWAGKAWGAVAIPRIGQEVIVDFLEGDPDQPIITGRVYNQDQMPPYELPANQTQSGLVSRSSPGGSADTFNELMFEDKKGSELVYLRAEKDYTNAVENDEVRWVGHDRWVEIDNDETITIHGNRTEEVDKDETITIHMNRKETVDKDETVKILGSRTHSISKNDDLSVMLQRMHTVGINETITVGAAQEVTVGGAQAISVGGVQSTNVGGMQTTGVGGNRSVSVGGNQTLTIGKNLTINLAKDETSKIGGKRSTKVAKEDSLEVEKKLTIVAGEAIMIKTGDASIEMKKNGAIIIKGKDITLDGSGKINVKASGDLVLKGSKITGN